MIGSNLLFDTNILIYLSKGELELKVLTEKYDKIYISVISYMEALGYAFKNENEKRLIERLLQSFEIVQTDIEIANTVVEIRKMKKIKTPDAIIFSTAKKNKCRFNDRKYSRF